MIIESHNGTYCKNSMFQSMLRMIFKLFDVTFVRLVQIYWQTGSIVVDKKMFSVACTLIRMTIGKNGCRGNARRQGKKTEKEDRERRQRKCASYRNQIHSSHVHQRVLKKTAILLLKRLFPDWIKIFRAAQRTGFN
jgi:hypothetical protein